MQNDFDLIPERLSTECEKWHAYEPDVLPLWVADMDFRSPQPVIDALRARVDHGIFGYPVNNICGLVETIVERMERLYKWKINPEEVILVPGVVSAFNLVCHAFGRPGEGVLIQTPVYPPFLYAAKNAAMIRQEALLTCNEDGNYSIDFDRFEAAITPQTRIFILCNPHNPVGRVFRKDELRKLAEICLQHHILICSDEIHCDLIFSSQRHIPIASINPEIKQHSITLMAPSKTFNIPGLNCSFAIVQNTEHRKSLQKARQGMLGGVNLMGQVAALAAYRDSQAWLEDLLGYLEANRDFLYQYLKEKLPGIRMWKPEGTYLAWLDCRQSGIQGNPFEFFLKNARVALNDGCSFGNGGEGFVRLNFGCPRSLLVEALDRMRNALQAVH